MRKNQLARNLGNNCYEPRSDIPINYLEIYFAQSLILKSIASLDLRLLDLMRSFSLQNAILISKRQRRAQTSRPIEKLPLTAIDRRPMSVFE